MRYASTRPRRAQAWYTDVVVAVVLFALAASLYFKQFPNLTERMELDDVAYDSQSISSTLITAGYPENWNPGNVRIIGIGGSYRLNPRQLYLASKIPPSRAKALFSVTTDYAVLVMQNKSVLNIWGVCSLGEAAFNMSNKVAYYSSGMPAFQDAAGRYNATVYTQLQPLLDTIGNYTLVILERPGDLTPLQIPILENFTASGGTVVIGDFADTDSVLSSTFSLHASQPATATSSQTFGFTPGQGMYFEQNYSSVLPANGTIIAEYSDGSPAIATWPFGNGTVYFLSSFNATYNSSPALDSLETGIRSLIRGECWNYSLPPHTSLAKTERLLAYNGEVVSLAVYSLKT